MGPRLLLVDDHEIVRQAIASLLTLRWGYDICGEAANGQEAIEKVIELHPDVVVLDLSMPVMTGTAAARVIHRIAPQTRIIFLSMHDSETIIELTKLVGADACLSKRSATSELNKAIVAVLKIEHDEFEFRRRSFFDSTEPTKY